MPENPVRIGPHVCGRGRPLLVIAGPCVIETRDLTLRIAKQLADVATRHPIQLVFKASFDKANRTSADAYRGPGMEEGLKILHAVSQETSLSVTTDIHEAGQAEPAASVCDMLQIPAFLCRQTDLLLAAAKTKKVVNAKKGQFMAPADMQYVIEKLSAGGCDQVMLCERGTFFGYGRLITDFKGLVQLRGLGAPVIFDATHSVQEPGGLGGATGGNRALVEPLARAAVAVGVDGLFFETHPDPEQSPSDGPNMVPLEAFEPMIERLCRLRQAVEESLSDNPSSISMPTVGK